MSRRRARLPATTSQRRENDIVTGLVTRPIQTVAGCKATRGSSTALVFGEGQVGPSTLPFTARRRRWSSVRRSRRVETPIPGDSHAAGVFAHDRVRGDQILVAAGYGCSIR